MKPLMPLPPAAPFSKLKEEEETSSIKTLRSWHRSRYKRSSDLKLGLLLLVFAVGGILTAHVLVRLEETDHLSWVMLIALIPLMVLAGVAYIVSGLLNPLSDRGYARTHQAQIQASLRVLRSASRLKVSAVRLEHRLRLKPDNARRADRQHLDCLTAETGKLILEAADQAVERIDQAIVDLLAATASVAETNDVPVPEGTVAAAASA